MQRRNLRLSLLALSLGGLLGLAACGGGGTTGGGGGGGGGGGTAPSGVTIYPGGNGATVSMAVGASANFSAFALDAPANVNWTASGGTISGNGTPTGAFTAPTTAGTVTISAVALADMQLGGTVTVNVTAAPANGLLVSPGATSVGAGSVTAFAAQQNGTAITPAVWEVNGAPGGDSVHGTISASGNFTAPSTPPPTGSTTITACQDNACTMTASASVAVTFSTASLEGPYAFNYSGDDGSGQLAVVGHFTADGLGDINALDGVEDEMDFENQGGFSPDTPLDGGSYTVGPDGRTQVTFGTGEVLQIALTSNPAGSVAQHGVLIRFDSNATGSGTIDAQNINDLAQGFNGNYVFGISGVDINGLPLVMAGRFMAVNASLSIPSLSAEQDINDGGTLPSPNPDTTLTGSFQPDGNAATNGRGEVTFSSTNDVFETELGTNGTAASTLFAYYIVDSTHLKVVEIDNEFATSGDFFAETGGNGPFNASVLDKASYAFTSGGSSQQGAFSAGGVFVSGGTSGANSSSGTITGGVYDNNDGGAPQLGLTFGNGSYSVDSFGRITLTLSANNTSLSYFGYAGTYNTPNGAQDVVELIDETGNQASGSANFIDGGLAYEQTSANTPVGSFALNMSGIANGAKNGGEQDFEGQFVVATQQGASGTQQISGSIDINNIANGLAITPNVPLNASSVATVGSDGRGTPLTLHTSNPSTNFPLTYYVVDENTTLLMETDSARVLTGVIIKQY
jgi:hypothetical protein